jgi:aminoglycoside phosphotransferase family enzyme
MNSRPQHPQQPELREKVEFLSQPQNYPHPSRQVECLETHMSWVFLTDQHAWKMKKPVSIPDLDFSTLEKRRLDCIQEVKLNRRLAHRVYLGIVPLTLNSSGQLQLGGQGTVVEWLVQMQRLPDNRSLEYLATHGAAKAEDVHKAAELLAQFYHSSTPVQITGAQLRQRLLATILDNQQELSDPLFEMCQQTVDRLTAAQQTFVQKQASLLNSRVDDGHVIDAHGDLRPDHIWMVDPPVIIDCLEFSTRLRTMDPVSELAFLKLECDRLNSGWIADIFFQTYTRVTADDFPSSLTNFYRMCHACTRAKLALWHLRDDDVEDADKWKRKAARYLELAETP